MIERFCDDNLCSKLEKVAAEIADWRHVGVFETRMIKSGELSSSDAKRWTRMQQIANDRGVQKENLPTFGKTSTFRVWFLMQDTSIFPVYSDGDLLLGKIGTAGNRFSGSIDLFAAYRLVGDELKPVAGFTLGVTSRYIVGSTLSNK